MLGLWVETQWGWRDSGGKSGVSLEQGSVKGLLHLFLGYMSCPVVSEQFNSVKKNTKNKHFKCLQNSKDC